MKKLALFALLLAGCGSSVEAPPQPERTEVVEEEEDDDLLDPEVEACMLDLMERDIEMFGDIQGEVSDYFDVCWNDVRG